MYGASRQIADSARGGNAIGFAQLRCKQTRYQGCSERCAANHIESRRRFRGNHVGAGCSKTHLWSTGSFNQYLLMRIHRGDADYARIGRRIQWRCCGSIITDGSNNDEAS